MATSKKSSAKKTKIKKPTTKSSSKKNTKKSSSPGIIKKAKKVLGNILKGATSSAIEGAKEAVEKEAGLDSNKKDKSSKKNTKSKK